MLSRRAGNTNQRGWHKKADFSTQWRVSKCHACGEIRLANYQNLGARVARSVCPCRVATLLISLDGPVGLQLTDFRC